MPLKYFAVLVLCLSSVANAQLSAEGSWLGKVVDPAQPCRPNHFKLELKQNESRLTGTLALKVESTGSDGSYTYKPLGTVLGAVTGKENDGLELTLRSKLAKRAGVNKVFLGTTKLFIGVTEMPAFAGSRDDKVGVTMGFIAGPPLVTLIKFGSATHETLSEAQHFNRLDSAIALQYLTTEQLAGLVARQREFAEKQPTFYKGDK